MQVIGVDEQGHRRCWWCGGQEFAPARMTRETIVLGFHMNLTRPTLRCAHCGECSDMLREAEYS